MTDTKPSPIEVMEDEMDEFGLSPWFEQTDFEIKDCVRNIMQALADAGYVVADTTTHVVVPREVWEKADPVRVREVPYVPFTIDED